MVEKLVGNHLTLRFLLLKHIHTTKPYKTKVVQINFVKVFKMTACRLNANLAIAGHTFHAADRINKKLQC